MEADSSTQVESSPVDEGSKDRLAALLKAQHGSDFHYDVPEKPEPEGQPEPEEPVAEVPEEAPPETETEPEQSEPDEGQPDELETFTADDGKEYRVPKELKDHLLRDRDYRHKTMELAEERKSVAQTKQYVEAAAHAATQLSDLVAGVKLVDYHAQQLSKQLEADPQMETNDPIGYLQLQNRMRGLMDQRNSLVQQFGQADHTLKQAQEAEFQAKVARQAPLLAKKIPDWSSDKAQALHKYGVSEGYTEQEMNRLADHRHVVTLWKAHQFDQLTAKRAQTAKTVQAAPPVNKQTQPRVTGREIELKKAEARFAKSGDSEDLVAVLKARRNR